MKIEAHIINAFVDGNIGGNPAGVVLNADDLSKSQKLEIASIIGLSETAFVSSSKVADFKLDFFTPTKQIAHCGHATIATFVYLRELGLITKSRTSKETIDGNRDIYFDGDMAFMEQMAPSYKEIDHCIDDICSSLKISIDDLLSDHNPFIVNTGNSFLIVPLKDEKAVLGAHADLDEIQRISEEFGLIGYYIFSQQTKKPGRDAATRMFALACYLYEKIGIKKDVFLIEQGHLMKSPSPSVIKVHLNFEDGKISGLIAGGKAKVKKSMII